MMFNPTRKKKELKSKGREMTKFCLKIKECAKEYTQISTLHGIRNVTDEGSSFFERIFWIVVSLSSCIMALFMVQSLWLKFQQSPTMITIENNNQPIKDIPFPAVTICNTNKILKSSAEIMIQKFVAMGGNETEVIAFLKELPQVYTTRLNRIINQEKMSLIMKKLGYNLETLLLDSCSRLLVRCLWLGDDYNCSSIFVDLKTSEGFCCSFNWKGPRLKGYPNLSLRKDFEEQESVQLLDILNSTLYVNEASMPTAGLQVVIDSEVTNYYASVNSYLGSVILLHSPEQYPDLNVQRAFVQQRFEVMFRLSGSIVESSSNVRGLNYAQRQCYFPDEVTLKDSKVYDYDQCILDCKIRKYNSICGCAPFYFPRPKHTKACGLEDLKCLRDNRAILGSRKDTDAEVSNNDPGDVLCNCLPLCSGIEYSWIALGNKIYAANYASPLFEMDLKEKSALSVFFNDNVCIKYRRESIMSWDGVLAALGGIFGLCMGGSIISFIELFYYFVYSFCKKRHVAKNEVFTRTVTSQLQTRISNKNNPKIIIPRIVLHKPPLDFENFKKQGLQRI